MWFIGVEVEQETSAPPPKKILDPPLKRESLQRNFFVANVFCQVSWLFIISRFQQEGA